MDMQAGRNEAAVTYWMRQCNLEKPIPGPGGGTRHQVSWIPEEFAKKGKFLRLKEGDVWEDGWKVTGVGARKLSTDTKAVHPFPSSDEYGKKKE